jgi:hypothetical protein
MTAETAADPFEVGAPESVEDAKIWGEATVFDAVSAVIAEAAFA